MAGFLGPIVASVRIEVRVGIQLKFPCEGTVIRRINKWED